MRLNLQALEDRLAPAGVFPNDPQFPQQWPLHNTEQTGGLYDADIDMPEAWTITTGSMATVIAVLDSGIDYTHPDIYLNIWINESEIPVAIATNLTDVDGDGIVTFRDLNTPANVPYVTDVNGTGYIDSGDLLNDARWENGLDEDGNGKVDDLVGWDFHDNDNDPYAALAVADHGTHMSQRIAAMGNDGVGMVGVMWNARLMNVRINLNNGPGNHQVENCIAGIDYAVAEGASISNNSWVHEPYSQPLYDAIDRARLAGHLFVAAAGNNSRDNDAVPFYPASYDLDNVISVLALNSSDQPSSVTNWGQVTVDLGAPSDTGATSKATPIVTGVAGLLRTLHPDWTYAQIKAQILATVDPVPSLAGKTVTGGRLNAASALGYAWSPTKFYVVNDATRDQTYEYETTPQFITANGLGSGNSSPRGAASTASGDRVWVVDANKSVYVYDTSGGLLVSWVAGGLNPTTQIEGIATNGTDIWIVDAKQDKVYKYSGAASQLSGSQNAASSFSLNNGNKNPKDLVTDGTSIWVVDDGSTDKVFKYTLSGAWLGSWTITGGGGSPAGITLDPSNVQQHLWIVDNAADKVFQYDNARSRTSGSQAANASSALAAGNTNPQGIADPPAISIGDATAIEGGAVYRFTDNFVAPDGYGLSHSRVVLVGPDGNVYVANLDSNSVKVFEAGTGRYLRDLSTPGGELGPPWAMTFGPDGRLYVHTANAGPHNVVRFNIGDGSYDVFVAPGSGGLGNSHGLTFGPDGNLYVATVMPNPTMYLVKRYSGGTGAYLGDFVTADNGGLITPQGVVFGPDGNLYVASRVTNEVKRYNGQTGAYLAGL